MITILFLLMTLAIFLLVLYEIQYFFLFEPKKYKREPLDDRFTSLEIKAQDGISLEGVIYEPKEFQNTILYFGGRSQDSVALISKLALNFPTQRIITYNYRGYGDSKGSLNETAMFEDALFVARKLQEHYAELSIIGFSLGSSLAAFVAAKLYVKHLFLIGAFDSVHALTKRKFFLLPSLLIRYRFDTALHVSSVEARTYFVSSKDDTIVPLESSYSLKIRIKNLVEFQELSGYNHDEILFSPETIDLVKRVLG